MLNVPVTGTVLVLDTFTTLVKLPDIEPPFTLMASTVILPPLVLVVKVPLVCGIVITNEVIKNVPGVFPPKETTRLRFF
jgi:hypothetical protein